MIKGRLENEMKHEKSCHKSLKEVEQKIKEHFNLLKAQIKFQGDALEQLWVLVQSEFPTEVDYPQNVTRCMESELLCDAYFCISQVFISNTVLRHSLKGVIESCIVLSEVVRRSELVAQNVLTHHTPQKKSIYSCIEIVQDVLNFCCKVETKLKVLAKLLTANSIDGVNRYKKFIASFEDPFNAFIQLFINSI